MNDLKVYLLMCAITVCMSTLSVFSKTSSTWLMTSRISDLISAVISFVISLTYAWISSESLKLLKESLTKNYHQFAEVNVTILEGELVHLGKGTNMWTFCEHWTNGTHNNKKQDTTPTRCICDSTFKTNVRINCKKSFIWPPNFNCWSAISE